MTTQLPTTQIPDLTPADEQWLRDFLATARLRAPDTLGLEELYGFLFAVVSAPDLVLPSEWIPAIFDVDGPVFADEPESVRFHHVAMALYNQLNRDVLDATVRLPERIVRRSERLRSPFPRFPAPTEKTAHSPRRIDRPSASPSKRKAPPITRSRMEVKSAAPRASPVCLSSKKRRRGFRSAFSKNLFRGWN